MLATRDEALLKRVQQLNNHGRAAGDMRQFWPSELGHKYKISNLQAALGCAQLERIEGLVARKREIFAFYQERLLAAIPGAGMNPEAADCRNSYWMPTLVLPSELAGQRDRVLMRMGQAGIDARIFFQPLSDTPVFASLPPVSTPRAHDLALRAFNLPSYHDLVAVDQQRVVDAILQGLQL